MHNNNFKMIEPGGAGECYYLAVKSALISAGRDGSSRGKSLSFGTLGHCARILFSVAFSRQASRYGS
jgi:hypothetical protein